MKLNKKERNRKYIHILFKLYAARDKNTSFYICHALDFLSCEYKTLLKEYSELEILLPENFMGKSITEISSYFKESDYVLREIILLFAIEMTE